MTKKHNIDISDCGKVLVITVHQQTEIEYAIGVMQESIKKADEKSIDHFLFDVSALEVSWGDYENYTFAKQLAAMGFSKLRKIALFAGDKWKEYEFFETATQNWGFNVQIFSDRNTAMQWCRETCC